MTPVAGEGQGSSCVRAPKYNGGAAGIEEENVNARTRFVIDRKINKGIPTKLSERSQETPAGHADTLSLNAQADGLYNGVHRGGRPTIIVVRVTCGHRNRPTFRLYAEKPGRRSRAEGALQRIADKHQRRGGEVSCRGE